jgi:hypothetical protein
MPSFPTALPPAPLTADAAYLQIRDASNQGWELERRGQMQDVVGTFNALTPAEAQQVFDRLDPAHLNALADDITATGVLGAAGLNRTERRALFNIWACQLTGPQLARAMKAFPAAEDTTSLAHALTNHASADVQLAFVESVDLQGIPFGHVEAGRLDTQPFEGYEPNTVFASAPMAVHPRAKAVAEVLAVLSERPQQFDTAVAHLADLDRLPLVVLAAEDRSATFYRYFGKDNAQVSATQEHPEPLMRISRAATEGANPDTRCAMSMALQVYRERETELVVAPAPEIHATLNGEVDALLLRVSGESPDCPRPSAPRPPERIDALPAAPALPGVAPDAEDAARFGF